MPETLTTLIFIKNEGNDANWTHEDGLGASYTVSKPELTSVNGMFQVKELNGAAHTAAYYTDITVRDDSGGSMGTPYTPTSPADLVNKLIELKYPAYNYLLSATTLSQVLANSPQTDGAVFVDVPIAFGMAGGAYAIISQGVISITDSAGNTVSLNLDGTIDVKTGGSTTKITGVDVVAGDQTLKLPNNSDGDTFQTT